MKPAPKIPDELAGLIGIVLDRMLADALAEQRQEQRADVQADAPVADTRASPAQAAGQR
jgi:hypothetical protein